LKRFFIQCLVFAAMLAVVVSACSSQNRFDVNKTGCITGFRWGETFEEVTDYLSKKGISYYVSVSEQSRKVLRLDTDISGFQANIDLKFSGLWPKSVPTGLYLYEIGMVFNENDGEQLVNHLNRIWGANKTDQPMYVSAYGEERVEYREAGSQDGELIWRSADALLDLFDGPAIDELFGFTQEALAEKSRLKRLYDSFLYSATLHKPDQGRRILEIHGYYSVIAELKS
jgi:hypothetical protein